MTEKEKSVTESEASVRPKSICFSLSAGSLLTTRAVCARSTWGAHIGEPGMQKRRRDLHAGSLECVPQLRAAPTLVNLLATLGPTVCHGARSGLATHGQYR